MISSIFNKIIAFIRRRQSSHPQKQEETYSSHGTGVKIKIYNSSSEILKRSRELKQGAIYSTVLLPDGADEKFRDPEVLFAPDLDTPLNAFYYDYLQAFEERNSLQGRGIPLCVGPDQVEFIKQTRAIYCNEQKCWFWPYEDDLHVDEMRQVLPRIHNPLCDHIDCEFGICVRPPLLPNLVPEPLWGINLRKFLSKNDWDFLRNYIYSQSGYRCSICGGKGEQWPVECDEVWDYRTLEDGREASILVGLRALCPRCHRVNHLGKANVDGKFDETIRHMAYINGWSLTHAESVADEAFNLFNERSEKSWLMGYDDQCQWTPAVEKILKTIFSEASAP